MQELAESPFMVGALGSPGCNPINLGALPSMGGGAISTAALAAADTAVAVLDLDVPTSGKSRQRGGSGSVCSSIWVLAGAY
eukprot:1146016-Pelagomonas_calceolata.AAC.5